MTPRPPRIVGSSSDAHRVGQRITRRSALGAGVALALTALDPTALRGLIAGDPNVPVHFDLGDGRTMNSDNGIITVASHHSVDDTVAAVEGILRTKGIKLFATVDHGGEAKAAGLTMRPTKLLIFGNPKAGTPLMVASPSIALDLPLKLLIWEDTSGKVWLSYNAPSYLQDRHGLPEQLVPVLAGVAQLATGAAG